MVKDISFSEWLNDQMQQRNWSQAKLARAAGLGPTTINNMLTSKSKRPDPESCLGIARALGLAPETVFRAAKLLPTEPQIPELDDLKMVMAEFTDQERQEILGFAKVKLEIKRAEEPAVPGGFVGWQSTALADVTLFPC